MKGKMRRKIFSVLLSTMMLITMMPMMASAIDISHTLGSFVWTQGKNTVDAGKTTTLSGTLKDNSGNSMSTCTNDTTCTATVSPSTAGITVTLSSLITINVSDSVPVGEYTVTFTGTGVKGPTSESLNGSVEATFEVQSTVKTYDVKIGGTQITEENKDDVLKDGTVKYIPDGDDAGTLTLDGANITVPETANSGTNGIMSNIKDLTIDVKSDSKINVNVSAGYGMTINETAVLTGTGKLSVISSKGIMGIAARNLTNNIDLDVSAQIPISISEGNFYQKKGKINAMATNGHEIAVGLLGLNCKDCVITGGEINAKGGEASEASGGLFWLPTELGYTIKMTGGKVIADAGKSPCACGFGCSNDMEIKGADIIATASGDLPEGVTPAKTYYTPIAKGLPPVVGGTEIVPTTIGVDYADNAVITASANLDGSNEETYDSTKIPTMGYKYMHVKVEKELSEAEQVVQILLNSYEVTPRATINAKGQASLTWNKISPASGYEVYGEGENGEYELLDTVETNSASVKICKSYKIRKYAKFKDNVVYGNYSKPAKLTLGVTKILQLKSKKRKTMTIKFAPVAGAQTYQILYKVGKKSKVVGTSRTAAVIKKLKSKKKYSVYVRGVYAAGPVNLVGPWSAAKKVKIK